MGIGSWPDPPSTCYPIAIEVFILRIRFEDGRFGEQPI